MAAAALARGLATKVMKVSPGRRISAFYPSHSKLTGSTTLRRLNSGSSKMSSEEEIAHQLLMELKKSESTEANAGKAVDLAKELLRSLKAPQLEANEKVVNLAENLLKALKATPEPLALEVKLDRMESQINEVKALGKISSGVGISMLGVFACILFTIPVAIYEINLRSNNQKKELDEIKLKSKSLEDKKPEEEEIIYKLEAKVLLLKEKQAEGEERICKLEAKVKSLQDKKSEDDETIGKLESKVKLLEEMKQNAKSATNEKNWSTRLLTALGLTSRREG